MNINIHSSLNLAEWSLDGEGISIADVGRLVLSMLRIVEGVMSLILKCENLRLCRDELSKIS